MRAFPLCIVLFVSLLRVEAFVSRTTESVRFDHLCSAAEGEESEWKLEIDMPPAGSDKKAFVRVSPILSVPSEIVEVRYKVPFGLDVEPKKSLAVCTKDGEGGERVGDVLRYTSQWTLGLPAGEGLANTAASFAGGLAWTCTLFDVMQAKAWEQVVEALVSNVQERTDEVVLLFERPLEGSAPELE